MLSLIIFLALYGIITTFHLISLRIERRKKEECDSLVAATAKHGHHIHPVAAVTVVVSHPVFIETGKEFVMHMVTGFIHAVH